MATNTTNLLPTVISIPDEIQKVKSSNREQYVTLPWMTKYEFDQLIGLRTMHLSRGAIPMIDLPVDYSIEGNMELRKVAIEEIKQNKLPYIIKRVLPNGKVEYWPVAQLSTNPVRHMMR